MDINCHKILKCRLLMLLIFCFSQSVLLKSEEASLPKVSKIKLQGEVLPCRWQTVIFRNYGFVSDERLATVLRCDKATIRKEAVRLGLGSVRYNKDWENKGYITMIRNNWYLLPYDQLQKLLNFSREKLVFILKEEDFLSHKLGGVKPECQPVYYTPLTEVQKMQTEQLVNIIRPLMKRPECKPFDFFKGMRKNKLRVPQTDGVRMLHGYLTSCGDVFAADGRTHLSDELLKQYMAVGVNALFIHGQLSKLADYPFDKSLSQGYELRRKNLKELIRRADRYGIKIYLYINEPRALPTDNFPEQYAHLKGHTAGGQTDLCFSQKEVRDYLYNTIRDIVTDMPLLGGFMTITMSENATHCKSSGSTNCEHCKDVPAEQLAAEVNNTIYRAICDSHSKARLIANLWGWAAYMGWSKEQVAHGIEMLDKGISVLCVSEFNLPLEKGGIKCSLIDYSISNPGPSETTRWMLAKAEETGHEIFAKIQVNNSWECSCVPYLPVYDLVLEHIKNLQNIHVKNFMLTWTLGGWPSPMLNMVAASSLPNFNLDSWYNDCYGSEGRLVHEAVKRFCDGFREFPFSVTVLYTSPKNLGMANLWNLQPEQKSSSMVCYSFDDYEHWMSPYTYDVYTDCMEKMLRYWREGCKLLSMAKKKNSRELQLYAEIATLHMEADLLQTRFSYYKRHPQENEVKLKEIVQKAIECTERLLQLVDKDAKIAFETSNHYFYTSRNLLEQYLHLKTMVDVVGRDVSKISF